MARIDEGGPLARNLMQIRFVAGVLVPLVLVGLVFVYAGETRGERAAARTAAALHLRSIEAATSSLFERRDLVFPVPAEDRARLDAVFADVVAPAAAADELRIVNAGGVVVYSIDPAEIGSIVELTTTDERALAGSSHVTVGDAEGEGALLTYTLPVRLEGSPEVIAVVQLSGVDDVALGQLSGLRTTIRGVVLGGLSMVAVIQLWMLLRLLHRLWNQWDRSRHMAHYDPLTGLANRLHFHDRLAEAIAAADRREGNVGLVMIDLDGFKPVNDTGGHAAGDRLLKRVAAKLAEVTRREEVAARVGGDEFAVIIPHLESPGQLAQMAERLRDELDLSVDFTDGRAIRVTASLGLAVYPIDARSPDDLVAAADVAMYGAKASRKSSRDLVAQPPAGALPERIFG